MATASQFNEDLSQLDRSIADFGIERTAILESVLSEYFGGAVEVIDIRQKGDAQTAFISRTFWRVIVAHDGGLKTQLHVKCCRRNLGNLELMDALNDRGLPVPDFVCTFSHRKQDVIVWKHCEGEPAKSFVDLSPEDIVRVVAAVAEVGALPNEIVGNLGIPSGLQWIRPIAKEVRQFVKNENLTVEEQKLDLLDSVEAKIIEEFDALECETLTHNDLKAPNVLLSEESVTLVDWESASLSPHGFSLRRFTRHGPQIESLAVQAYVNAMALHGITVYQSKVLRAMRFQEVFWALYTGVRQRQETHRPRSIDRLLLGLNLLPEFLSRPAAY